MPNVRFTGERTGLDSIPIYPYGKVSVGDVVEVSTEEAERFTTLHPTGEYGTAEDVEAKWTRDELDVIARDHGIDPTQYKKKSDLAEAVWEVDKTAAGQVHKADFVTADAGEDADMAAFGDKAAEPVADDTAETTDEGELDG